jgi:phosphoglycerate dehydrogenase-like enzyme
MSQFKVVMIANDDHPIPDWLPEKFTAANVEYVYHQCYGREDLQACATDADVLWLMSSGKGVVVEENMDIFKKVGAAIKCGSGTDNIDHEACTRRGIIVAHTPEDPVESTSDHAIALLLTALRRTAVHDRLVRRGDWNAKNAPPLGAMTGADLGLIGFGRIGKTIIQKLSGFQLNIRVFDPFLEADTIKAAGYVKVSLEELLTQSQYVMVQCPLNEETRGLIGEKELRMMRSDATLVNCARGGIVSEAPLYQALKEGWIRAAALDVTEKPLGVESELLSLDNFNITPHMGGYPANYPDNIFDAVVEVILEMSRQHRPQWIVNKNVVPKWDLQS